MIAVITCIVAHTWISNQLGVGINEMHDMNYIYAWKLMLLYKACL